MADVELRLTADLDGAKKGIAGFRKEYVDLVKAVEKPLRQISGFRDLETELEGAGRGARTARERVRDLGNELARTATPTKQLTTSYRAAVAELRRMERAEASAQAQLAKRRSELQAAGVDTRNLAAEQKRLSSELQTRLSDGRADADLSSARKSLGVGEIEQAQRELVELRAQYRLVSSDASLSAKQRAEAEATYRKSVSQSLESLRQMRAATAAPASKADAAAQLQREAAATSELARQNAQLSAQRALGVGKIQAEQQALLKLRQQYQLVNSDSSLSGTQRAEAESTYRRRVSESLAELRKMRTAIQAQASQSQLAAAAESQRNAAALAGIRARTAELRSAALAERQVALEQARQSLGVTQYRAATSEVQRLRAQYEQLRAAGNLTGRELAVAQNTLTQRIRESQKAMAELAGQQQRAKGGALLGQIGGTLASFGGAYGAVSAVRSYVEIADSSKKMDAQLKLATRSQEQFSQAQEDTYRIAQTGRVPLEDVVTLYSRLSPALRDLGRNQKDVAGVTEAVTAALRISGSTSSESAATLTQFSQALGSGVLRGEEFNSIAENAPRLLRALADGLNVPTGALRAMAAEGQLTADVITDLTLKALPQLQAEAAQLPQTVDGALTQLSNKVVKAFSEGDTSGFIGAIEKLGEVLSDPGVVQGLSNLAGAAATLASWAAQGATEFANLGKEIGYVAAEAMGGVDQLTRLEKFLEGLKAARNGGAIIGRPFPTFFQSNDQIDNWIKDIEGQIDKLNAAMQGTTVERYREQKKAAEDGLKAQQEADKKQAALDETRVDAMNRSRSDVAAVRNGVVEDLKKAIKAEQSAERKAVTAAAKVRAERLEIEKKYAEAQTQLSSTGAGASYSSAQDLKLAANKALSAGDYATAQKQADAALKVLLDLQEAGANTYGFKGFADQLKQIELAANDLEQTSADQKVEDLTAKIKHLKDEAAELKDLRINLSVDDAQLEAIKAKLKAAAAEIGKTLTFEVSSPSAGAEAKAPKNGVKADDFRNQVAEQLKGSLPVPVEVVPELTTADHIQQVIAQATAGAKVTAPVTPELDQSAVSNVMSQIAGLSDKLTQQLVVQVSPQYYQNGSSFSQFPATAAPGYAGGGHIRGPGTGTSDSILMWGSNGEFMQPAAAVRYYGAEFMEAVRQRRLPRFAEGGAIGSRPLPSIPAMAPALAAAAAGSGGDVEPWGTLALELGGKTYNVKASRSTAEELHIQALKFGGTKR